MSQSDAFRASEIEFRLTQNRAVYDRMEQAEKDRDLALASVKEWASKLQTLQSQHEQTRQKRQAAQSDTDAIAKEVAIKKEHIRLLADQNAGQLRILEQYESAREQAIKRKNQSESEIKILRQTESELEDLKRRSNDRVTAATASVINKKTELSETREAVQDLRLQYTSIEAQVTLDLDAMEQAINTFKTKNAQYVNEVEQSNSRLRNLEAEISNAKSRLFQVKSQKEEVNKVAQAELDARETFGKSRAELIKTIEREDAAFMANKELLSALEKEREKLTTDRREQDQALREAAEKGYAIMDAIRAVEVEDKKAEAEASGLEKKLRALAKNLENLNAKIEIEKEGKELAERERGEVEAEVEKIKKSSKKLEEEINKNQKVAEKRMKDLVDINARNNQLWNQNAYLSSRLDNLDEDKNTLLVEAKVKTEKLNALVREIVNLKDEIVKGETNVKEARDKLIKLQTEYEYIHRLDAAIKLDANGQLPPIQIVSNENTLLAKLQINEFLSEVQHHRQPIPLLIEKVAALLAQLHADQQNADTCLQSLGRSNTMVSQLRGMNVQLIERKHLLANFKLQAVTTYVVNQLDYAIGANAAKTAAAAAAEGGSGSLAIALILDGLGLDQRQLEEVLSVVRQFKAEDKITVVSLVDNALVDAGVSTILQAVFNFPYLKSLDIRRNMLTLEGINSIEGQIRALEGVTAVVVSQGINGGPGLFFEARSGPQVRLRVDTTDQQKAAENKAFKANQLPMQAGSEANVTAADDYLQSAPGMVAPYSGPSKLPPLKSMTSQLPSALGSKSLQGESLLTGKGTPLPSTRNPVVPVGLGGPGDASLLDNSKAAAARAVKKAPPSSAAKAQAKRPVAPRR